MLKLESFYYAVIYLPSILAHAKGIVFLIMAAYLDANLMRYYLAFAVAIISDLLDYTVLGSLPIIGDAIDAMTIPVLYALIGKFSLLGVLEFVPFADLIPSYTIAVALSYMKEKKKRQPPLRRLSTYY